MLTNSYPPGQVSTVRLRSQPPSLNMPPRAGFRIAFKRLLVLPPSFSTTTVQGPRAHDASSAVEDTMRESICWGVSLWESRLWRIGCIAERSCFHWFQCRLQSHPKNFFLPPRQPMTTFFAVAIRVAEYCGIQSSKDDSRRFRPTILKSSALGAIYNRHSRSWR